MSYFARRRGSIFKLEHRNYLSADYRRLFYTHSFRQSREAARATVMTTRRWMGFFSGFKAELVESGIFESVEQSRSEIFIYIEGHTNGLSGVQVWAI